MQILYEDNHLLAVYKPSGTLTHGDRTGDNSILEQAKSYIKEKYNKPGAVFLQPVHRIDRPTSGLILFARTSKATTRLTKAFKAREIDKTYYAIVNRAPKKVSTILQDTLWKDRKNNVVKVVAANHNKGKEAILRYQLLKERNGRFLLKICPETGRSHQIRVQLANIGCPIEGDLKYGSTQKTDGRSIALHAYELKLIHPTKKEQVMITCPFPQNQIWKDFL